MQAPRLENMMSFRVLSFNIHKGLSPLNRHWQLSNIANALRTVGADILCLQEVQGQNDKQISKFGVSAHGQSNWLSKQLALNDCYGKNCSYPHGHHGNAILSRYPIDFKTNFDLTVNRFEYRGMLHCEVHIDNRPLLILCCHLNLLNTDRQKQYRLIAEYIKQLDPTLPLVLAGDFNDWTGIADLNNLGLVEVFETQTGNFAKTFPAKLPILPLDRLYIRHLKVVQTIEFHHKIWKNLSDHLPIGAVLDWEKA